MIFIVTSFRGGNGLAERLTRGQGGAGSHPVILTNKYRAQSTLSVEPFSFGLHMGNTVTSPHAGQE